MVKVNENFEKVKGVQFVLGKMGNGKTLYATLKAIEYRQHFPENKIIANYHIKNLDNFEYNPFMFFPFSEIKDCLIIIDDIYTLDDLNAFMKVLVNMSRKRNCSVILTGQYYSMIKKQIRKLSNFEVRPYYSKKTDLLYCFVYEREGGYFQYQLENATEIAGNYYDTKEVVVNPILSDYAKEIMNYASNNREFHQNLKLFSSSERKKNKLIKYIDEHYPNYLDSIGFESM